MKLPTTHPLLTAAQSHPLALALITGGTTLNYPELLNKALGIRQSLFERGLKADQVVVLDNLPPEAMIVALWACSLGRFIAFPLNTRFPASTLKATLSNLNPAMIISDRGLIPSLAVTFNELTESSQGPDARNAVNFNLDEAATLLMTSGSSGTSKIVVHSHGNHIANALGSNLNIPISANDRWLISLPLYHVGGLSILYRTTLTGATVVIPDPQTSLLESITKYQISHISLVATQLQELLEEPKAHKSLQKLKAILLGGSAIPKSLLKRALQLELPIHISYGSTEMASQITTTQASDRSTDLNNSGTLLAGRDLIISAGGEILVRGQTLALGYQDGLQRTDLRDAMGWFHTGDIGYLEVQGKLTVTGRLDNQFISGGENIQPEQIETILTSITGISQALVLAQQDEKFGMRPVAYIQTNELNLKVGELVTELKKSLPGYMIPVAFFQMPAELLQDRMKLSRKELMKFMLSGNNHLHALA